MPVIYKGLSLRFHKGGATQVSAMVLYVGEASEREQCGLLCSLPVFSHLPRYPQANWDFLVLIPRWVGLCTS